MYLDVHRLCKSSRTTTSSAIRSSDISRPRYRLTLLGLDLAGGRGGSGCFVVLLGHLVCFLLCFWVVEDGGEEEDEGGDMKYKKARVVVTRG